jgi:hypothetical protein
VDKSVVAVENPPTPEKEKIIQLLFYPKMRNAVLATSS